MNKDSKLEKYLLAFCLLILAFFAAILIYDYYLFYNEKVTISQYVRNLFSSGQIVLIIFFSCCIGNFTGFITGGLLAHWFWSKEVDLLEK